jgi:hypothetical protein
MKDAYEVLRQKQAELDRVRKEVESLKIVESLLSEDVSLEDPTRDTEKSNLSSLDDAISRLSDSAASNVEHLFPSAKTSHSRFWNTLKRTGSH